MVISCNSIQRVIILNYLDEHWLAVKLRFQLLSIERHTPPYTHSEKLIKNRDEKEKGNWMQGDFDHFSMWSKRQQIQQDADFYCRLA